MRFGVCTGHENIGILEESGYDYIELGLAGTLELNLEGAFTNSSLGVETTNGLLPGELKIIGDDLNEIQILRYLKAAFSRAEALGVKVCVFGSGKSRQIPDGFSRNRAREQTLNFLNLCGEIAARHDMMVAIEPLNRAECNWINSVGEAVALAQIVNHAHIGVLSDLYHITQEGQNYDDTRDAGTLLAHVHIAGREDRRAPLADDFEYLVPYFAVLKKMDYRGRISIECRWGNLAAEAGPALAVLRRAWKSA